MYIVVAGGGISGSTIARYLLDRKHDVVVIEKDRETCEELYAHIGVITVHGNAKTIEVLHEAGIEKADAAIATLYRDEDNLTFTLLAHSKKVPRILIQMRDPAYRQAYMIAGATSICDMNSMFTSKMLNELDSPLIQVITEIEGGKAQLIMFELPATFPGHGIRVQDMVKDPAFAHDCVFAGVIDERSEKIVVPRGNDRLYPGNKVFMVVGGKGITAIEQYLEKIDKKQPTG